MSETTRYRGLCGHCGCTVEGGQGVIRRWNGAARRYAPKYAAKNAMGVITALHCQPCDTIYTTNRRIKK